MPLVAELQIAAAFGADDAERHRVAQAERAADRQHEIADVDRVAIADPRRHEIRRRDGHHGHVGSRVAPNFRRADLPAVGELDMNVRFGGRADDVPIGEHIEFAAQFKDRAGAGFFDRLVRIALGKRIGFRGFDMDDRRANKLDDALEHRAH